jgi:hypothetical protein
VNSRKLQTQMNNQFSEYLYNFIRTGGVILSLKVKGRVFLFRAPNPTDYERCISYGGGEREQEAYILALSLHSVGGFHVEGHEYDLLQFFKSTPRITPRLAPFFWKAIKNSQEQYKYFEAFCYTDISRSLWSRWKHSLRVNASIDGLRGVLNEIQMSWVIYNQTEDRKEELDDAWSRTFFQASTMNPKGVDQVQKKWDSRKEKESKYRQETIERARRGETNEDEAHERAIKGKTIEDLQKEYKSWVDGEEDHHDRVVREYKENLQKFINNGRSMVSRNQRQTQEMEEDLNSLSMLSPMKAYTDEELGQLLKGKKTIVIDEGHEYDDFLKSKYLAAREVTSGDTPSLMDQVAKRKPTIGG